MKKNKKYRWISWKYWVYAIYFWLFFGAGWFISLTGAGALGYFIAGIAAGVIFQDHAKYKAERDKRL
jgi:hypothetical protein